LYKEFILKNFSPKLVVVNGPYEYRGSEKAGVICALTIMEYAKENKRNSFFIKMGFVDWMK
jgi:hypothetical protein